jgi:hypothetical protein
LVRLCFTLLFCRQQRLATWISRIAELHNSRPAAAVTYSKPMPDVEVLMQVSQGLKFLSVQSVHCRSALANTMTTG